MRHVTIADLKVILGELDSFWDGRDTGFLHQALYVHEFGETSVLVERDGRIDGYLLGFVGQHGLGYIHAVAVRRVVAGWAPGCMGASRIWPGRVALGG
jgi:hypothetical protein